MDRRWTLHRLGPPLTPLSSATPVYDFVLTYTISGESIAYSMTGAYTHAIDCSGGEWLLEDTVVQAAGPGHVISYSGSYTQGRFVAGEQVNGVLTESHFRCPSFSLTLLDLTATNGAQASASSGCSEVIFNVEFNAPQRTVYAREIVYDSWCVSWGIEGAHTFQIPAHTPFSGRLSLKATDADGTFSHLLSCQMLAGRCWPNLPGPSTPVSRSAVGNV